MLIIISLGLSIYICMFSPFASFLKSTLYLLFALKAPTNLRAFLRFSLMIIITLFASHFKPTKYDGPSVSSLLNYILDQ